MYIKKKVLNQTKILNHPQVQKHVKGVSTFQVLSVRGSFLVNLHKSNFSKQQDKKFEKCCFFS